jgi:hypothetical protein
MVNFYYGEEDQIVTFCEGCADEDLQLIDRAGTGDICCECGAQNRLADVKIRYFTDADYEALDREDEGNEFW